MPQILGLEIRYDSTVSPRTLLLSSLPEPSPEPNQRYFRYEIDNPALLNEGVTVEQISRARAIFLSSHGVDADILTMNPAHSASVDRFIEWLDRANRVVAPTAVNSPSYGDTSRIRDTVTPNGQPIVVSQGEIRLYVMVDPSDAEETGGAPHGLMLVIPKTRIQFSMDMSEATTRGLRDARLALFRRAREFINAEFDRHKEESGLLDYPSQRMNYPPSESITPRSFPSIREADPSPESVAAMTAATHPHRHSWLSYSQTPVDQTLSGADAPVTLTLTPARGDQSLLDRLARSES